MLPLRGSLIQPKIKDCISLTYDLPIQQEEREKRERKKAKKFDSQRNAQ